MSIASRTDDPARMVYVTCPNADMADAIAHALVEHREAACVNIIPGLRSVYRWRGTVEANAEVLLLIKTRRACLAAVEHRVHTLHPDEVPEFVAVAIQDGSHDYLNWLTEQTGG